MQQVGEHKEDNDGPQLLLAKGQHHQGNAEVAGIAEHSGQNERRPFNPLEPE